MKTINIIKYIEDCKRKFFFRIDFQIFMNRWLKVFYQVENIQNDILYIPNVEIFDLNFDLYEYGQYDIAFNITNILRGKTYHNAKIINCSYDSEILEYVYHDDPYFLHKSDSIVLITDYMIKDTSYCVINGNHKLKYSLINHHNFDYKYIPFHSLNKNDFINFYSYCLFTFVNEIGTFSSSYRIKDIKNCIKYSKAKVILKEYNE